MPKIILSNDLISTIKEAIQKCEDTFELEELLNLHFLDFLSDERLLELPLSVLFRAVNWKWSQSDQLILWPFLMKCLDVFGQSATILFFSLDFSFLSGEQFSNLIKNPNFVHSFPKDSVISHYLELKRENEELKTKIKSLENLGYQLQKLENIEGKIQSLENIVSKEQTAKSILSKIQSLENIGSKIHSLENIVSKEQTAKSIVSKIQSLENIGSKIQSLVVQLNGTPRVHYKFYMNVNNSRKVVRMNPNKWQIPQLTHPLELDNPKSGDLSQCFSFGKNDEGLYIVSSLKTSLVMDVFFRTNPVQMCPKNGTVAQLFLYEKEYLVNMGDGRVLTFVKDHFEVQPRTDNLKPFQTFILDV